MDTLLDLIGNHERFGRREALVWFDGFRTWKLSYRDICDGIARSLVTVDRQAFAKATVSSSGAKIVLSGLSRSGDALRVACR